MIFHNRQNDYGRGRFAGRHLSGLQLVPREIVPVAQQVLRSQGINPASMNAAGEIDASSLIALAFNKIEIRTALTPPVMIDLNAKPDPETAKTMRQVKPALIMTGRAGRYEIAPYGMPNSDSLLDQLMGNAGSLGFGVIAGIFGLGLIAGSILARR